MNDPLLSSDGEEDPPDIDDDLCNWEYYTENFDTLEEEKVLSSSSSSSSSCLRANSGLRAVAKGDDASGGSVDSVTQGSSDVTFFKSHQTVNWYARSAAAFTVPSTTQTDETFESRPPNDTSVTADFSTIDYTTNKQGVRTQHGSKSEFDSSVDDSLSLLPFKYAHMRCSPHLHQSSTATATLPAAPAIFRRVHGDHLAPPLTFASPNEYGQAATNWSFKEKCFNQSPTVTYRSGSPLLLQRQHTQLCKPLTGYNYFYRDEKDNILRHLQQAGDPLPDPVCDFSAHKMEQLLHQHWYEFRHCDLFE
jgi:hypothetical protein